MESLTCVARVVDVSIIHVDPVLEEGLDRLVRVRVRVRVRVKGER